jgi:hypothetical protein
MMAPSARDPSTVGRIKSAKPPYVTNLPSTKSAGIYISALSHASDSLFTVSLRKERLRLGVPRDASELADSAAGELDAVDVDGAVGDTIDVVRGEVEPSGGSGVV